jgi:hypothetical protein
MGKESAMRISPLFLVPLLFGLMVLASPSGSIVNPHTKPEACDSCHTKIPSKDDNEFFLLKDSIDETCHVCHEKTCCKPGSLHGINHPSNIRDWDWDIMRRPKTLPLFDGHITCSTCHLHSKPEGESYKMVRIVEMDGKRIDWTGLCIDCHQKI